MGVDYYMKAVEAVVGVDYYMEGVVGVDCCMQAVEAVGRVEVVGRIWGLEGIGSLGGMMAAVGRKEVSSL